MKKVKAISLISGGLDSILATKLIQEQGIEVLPLFFKTDFFGKNIHEKENTVRSFVKDALGLDLITVDITQELLSIIKKPKYGHGKNLNPCIDCHLYMIKRAVQLMKTYDAQFVVTGEVLGERPMSQNKNAMMLIEKESGIKGYLLRPLSAKLMEITIPEKTGLVQRDKLYDIEGRSRVIQLKLAHKFGIEDFPWPGGGCLLTDKNFSKRLKDLISSLKEITDNDLKLLKLGRHHRLNSQAKFVVGRDESENNALVELIKEDDFSFYSLEIPGPVALLRGVVSEKEFLLCAQIVARYCDSIIDQKVEITYKKGFSGELHALQVDPCDDEVIKKIRL